MGLRPRLPAAAASRLQSMPPRERGRLARILIPATARTATQWISHIDAQDIQDLVSGVRRPAILSICNPAPDHHPRRFLVHEPFVLLILCILCIHVQKFDPLRRWADPSGGDGRGPARDCAGGTPAFPGGTTLFLARLWFNSLPHRRSPQRWRRRRGDSRPAGGSACRGLPGIEARL